MISSPPKSGILGDRRTAASICTRRRAWASQLASIVTSTWSYWIATRRYSVRAKCSRATAP
eukprot:10858001-Lingulodinium_polyedra.AAC.1